MSYPCGFYGDLKRECRCSPPVIQKYRQRISGPLLDRIDLHVEVPLLKYKALSSQDGGESSEVIRKRVEKARAVQCERFAKHATIRTNSAMTPRLLKKHCELDAVLSNDRASVIGPTISLAPHRPESFQLSTGPHFVEKVRDVVGLYMSPPNNALVLSMNDKSQCQALERSQPLLPCCQVARLNAPAMIISATAPSNCLPP